MPKNNKNNLIALRLSDAELDALDALGENRSQTIRGLIVDAANVDLDDPELDDPALDDGDIPRDIEREDSLYLDVERRR